MTPAIQEERLLIAGDLVPSVRGDAVETVDPSTGQVLARLARGDRRDVDAAVDAARAALPAWRGTKPAERARLLNDISRHVLGLTDELARLESLDIGKPLRQAKADALVAARYFEFYAGLADKILRTTIPLAPDYLDYTVREPIGVSAQIVPWNYPLQIGSRGIAPALAAGCTLVVKPAQEGSLSLLRVARLALDCGLPPGVLNVVTGAGTEAGAALASHPGINQLTFTGSVDVGTAVMQSAARTVVPVTLELGGKCPNLVFPDADLDAAVPVLLTRSSRTPVRPARPQPA